MTMFHKSNDVFDGARDWKYRVILASMPTTTGVIVRAVLGKRTKYGWGFGINCDIDANGMVRTAARLPNGEVMQGYPIGTVEAVRDSFRRLADHCKLSDVEREALFEELRKWIRRDHRATSDLDKAKVR